MAEDTTQPMVYTVRQIDVRYDNSEVTQWGDDRRQYVRGATHVTVTLTWHGDHCPPGFEEIGGQAVTIRRLTDG